MKKRTEMIEDEELIETESLICEVHKQLLIPLSGKLYCPQCKKFFKYKGHSVKIITPASPLREIKIPKKVKVSENI